MKSRKSQIESLRSIAADTQISQTLRDEALRQLAALEPVESQNEKDLKPQLGAAQRTLKLQIEASNDIEDGTALVLQNWPSEESARSCLEMREAYRQFCAELERGA